LRISAWRSAALAYFLKISWSSTMPTLGAAAKTEAEASRRAKKDFMGIWV